MLNDNDLTGYTADPATGFLEKKEKNSFDAFAKTKFLKALKTTGNQSKSIHDLGFSNALLELHLRKDLIFNAAYRDTLLEMRHLLEGNLYTAGLQGKAKEAQVWLQAFFPETYKPSAVSKKPKTVVDPLEGLYKKL